MFSPINKLVVSQNKIYHQTPKMFLFNIKYTTQKKENSYMYKHTLDLCPPLRASAGVVINLDVTPN